MQQLSRLHRRMAGRQSTITAIRHIGMKCRRDLDVHIPSFYRQASNPWTNASFSGADPDVLVVTLDVVALYNATLLEPTCEAHGSASLAPRSVPLSKTTVVRLCRTLLACQSWQVSSHIQDDEIHTLTTLVNFLSTQSVAPIGNLHDHAVVVTTNATIIALSNGVGSRSGVVGISRLGDQSQGLPNHHRGSWSATTCRCKLATLESWVCFEPCYISSRGWCRINATLTFPNADVYAGGFSLVSLVNFSGNVTLMRPTVATGIPFCVLGDSVLGAPLVPPGVTDSANPLCRTSHLLQRQQRPQHRRPLRRPLRRVRLPRQKRAPLRCLLCILSIVVPALTPAPMVFCRCTPSASQHQMRLEPVAMTTTP